MSGPGGRGYRCYRTNDPPRGSTSTISKCCSATPCGAALLHLKLNCLRNVSGNNIKEFMIYDFPFIALSHDLLHAFKLLHIILKLQLPREFILLQEHLRHADSMTSLKFAGKHRPPACKLSWEYLQNVLKVYRNTHTPVKEKMKKKKVKMTNTIQKYICKIFSLWVSRHLQNVFEILSTISGCSEPF